MDTDTAEATTRTDTGARYYVTVQDDPRVGFLAGPFETHAEALAVVEAAKIEAHKANRWSAFYAFGTACVKTPEAVEQVGPGLLNDRLGL